MHFLGIVLLSIVAAIIYGVLHDQVTARICVEYFAIGHPPIFATDDPTLLGIGWGIVATWWAGLMLGVVLASAARMGSWPKRSDKSMTKPILVLMAVMAVCATVAGLIGYFAARSGVVTLLPPLYGRVPSDKHIAFIVDAWAHSASYLVGFVGGLTVAVHVLVGRWRLARRSQK